jgi:hypothetical protein
MIPDFAGYAQERSLGLRLVIVMRGKIMMRLYGEQGKGNRSNSGFRFFVSEFRLIDPEWAVCYEMVAQGP